MKQELEKYRIKQLSIFSENRPGRLMDLARDMKDVNVNILGFTIAEGSGYGVVRMLVDKPEKALEKLSSQSHVVKFTVVIAVKMEDKPGDVAVPPEEREVGVVDDGMEDHAEDQDGPARQRRRAEFRAEYDGIIMGNCGYTRETAEERIAAGHADLAAFGRPFITNPDLTERFKNNWPLNPADDMSLRYTTGAEGYTDYKPYR